MKKGDTWGGAFVEHASMDPFTKGEVQKQMMLERFSEEVRCVYIWAGVESKCMGGRGK